MDNAKQEAPMSGLQTFSLGRGVVGVSYDGRDIGVVKHNVVGDGAIKWSAYDALGHRLSGTYRYQDEAVQAVASTR
jgi:hypothetical protein